MFKIIFFWDFISLIKLALGIYVFAISKLLIDYWVISLVFAISHWQFAKVLPSRYRKDLSTCFEKIEQSTWIMVRVLT